MLKDKLQEELKQSMLAKNELRTSVIRLLLSAITYHEIQKGGAGYKASDEDVIEVVGREIKKRRESIEMYESAARTELADKEKKELEILQTFLPEQMNEEEVRQLVKQAIKDTNAKTPQEMGKVMGALMPKVKGKADGTMVSNLVREELSA